MILPLDILLTVLNYTHQESLASLAGVCKEWNKAVQIILASSYKSSETEPLLKPYFALAYQEKEIEHQAKKQRSTVQEMGVEEKTRKIKAVFNQILKEAQEANVLAESYFCLHTLSTSNLQKMVQQINASEQTAKDLISIFDIICFIEPEANTFLASLSPSLSPLNKADTIREWMKDNQPLLEELEGLNLNNLQLQELPKEIGYLTGLRILSVSCNELKKLPKAIRNLTQLEELTLHDNKLEKLPDEIGDLSNLKILNLYNNNLTSLPKTIGRLTVLEEFYLDNNKLKELPDEMSFLTELKDLSVSTNQLEKLFKGIGNLIRLEALWLDENQLTEIPEELKNLIELAEFSLINNPQLTRIPGQLKGTAHEVIREALAPYLQQELEG